MNEYVTLYELRQYLGLSETDDDGLISLAVRAASRGFERWVRRTFYPLKATRYYDHPNDTASRLKLGADLLEVVTWTTQNGAVTLTPDQYYAMCGGSYNLTPYDRLVLRTDKSAVLSFSGTPQKANAVTAIWGYHTDYGNAWENSGDEVEDAAGITDTATTITVGNAIGAGTSGGQPRFQAGNLLKIEDEYLHLMVVDGAANKLTVRRAANGTTAATHAKDKPIYVWRCEYDVWEIVRELAAYLYALKDSQVFDVIASPETGTLTIPKGIPAGVKLAIPAYRPLRR